jgi:hypothetical protein
MSSKFIRESRSGVVKLNRGRTVVSVSPTMVSNLTRYESNGGFRVQLANAKRLQANGLIMTEPGHGLDMLRRLPLQLRSCFDLTRYEIRK